ncbi:proteasomal ATPase-associated factor 1 isoform X5 [Mirounga angustirostris]|uniref:proteasomal ATPase-associated factor 1 isoform X5 n=1 Tax=Mirounga leonina TaxID=9715 RepID=UPI00156C024D|nr:proteasomal ATPase-associated factor 1 isoform X5 [Mirounga leonina]XP_045750373.1 proteasomal ATPase-associated factor 1 isoform X6 [Mirounga angustirostris]
MAAPLRIQSDWAQALRKDEGEAWLSCHPPGKPTLYGSLTCQGIGQDGIPEVTASEGFIVNEINKALIQSLSLPTSLLISALYLLGQTKSIHISCPKENASSKFLAPYTTFSRIHSKSITCLDISSGGGLGVSSSTDGSMKIWQASNGELRRVLEGHVFDVNCCRFFPSGLVVLSGGMDAQLKIWSAEDASCVVTFKGHKGGEREVGTESKMLLLAREDKKLQCLGLQSRQPVFLFVGSDGFNCCTFLSGFLLLAGTQDGNIYQLDVRSPRAPVQVIHRSGAPVLSLLSFRDGFIASHGDGSCFIVQQDLDYLIELTGADCDPVFKVATWEKQIYTCCRDGLVRRYQLSDL